MSIESVMQSTHLILCHPFLLLLPLFPNLLNMLHQIKETEWKKTEQNYNENMHRMKLQFFWSKIKVKASLVLKKKKKNFQISRFSGMSPFNISPSLGETSSGEWIWDSKVMSGWTLIVSRSLLQHQTPAENVKAEKHQSTAEGQNEPHLTETPAYWGGALGKFFSKKGTVSWKLNKTWQQWWSKYLAYPHFFPRGATELKGENSMQNCSLQSLIDFERSPYSWPQ